MSKCHGRMGEAISHGISSLCLNICFFKILIWDFLFFRNFGIKIIGVEKSTISITES